MSERGLKAVLVVGLIAPLVWETLLLFTGNAGADPGKHAVHFLGQTSIWLLLLTMTATPLRVFLGARWLLRSRRWLGVSSFMYALVHLLAYVVFILGFDFAFLTEEIAKRPYITAGMASLALMLPLAITSNNWSVRLLGRRWRLLHKLIFPAVIAGVIHVWWQARSDIGFALLLAALFIMLLALRSEMVQRLRT